LDFVTGTNHTFEFPLKVASALHLTSYAPPPKLDSYVLVPFPTNVYTAFKFYFLDVGISGMLFIMLVVGLIHSLLYLKARQGGRLSLALFGYSFYAVLMVIFDDAYYTVGSYLRVFVFGFLYLMLSSLPLRVFPSVSQNPEKDRLFSS
jgi:oligosaccharide repeat unit polymerase